MTRAPIVDSPEARLAYRVSSPTALETRGARRDTRRRDTRDAQSRRAWLVPALVWGTLAALMVQAFHLIAVHGRNMPMVEDWLLVAPLTGHETHFVEWLLAQWSEHVVAVPKLIYLGVLKLSGGDFRSGMVLNTLILAALATACVVTAARRGRMRLTDAFFPLVFLNAGEAANYAWGWQIQYVAAVLFTCLPLLVIVRYGAHPPPRAALVAAVSIALVPFSGANGLIFFFALAPWYVLALIRQRATPRPPGARTRALLLGGGLLVGTACATVYLYRYYAPWWNPPNPGKRATVVTALKFAGMATGPGFFEHPRLVALVLTPVILGAAALIAVRAWRALAARDEERWRLAGLVCFIGGCAVLTAAMGYGRAAMVPKYGIPERYALLAAPTVVAAYFVWDLYGAAWRRRAAQWALLALAIFLLPANRLHGGYFLDWYTPHMDAVLADIRAGVPRAELAHRHLFYLMRWDEQGLVDRIGWLRDARIGPFARVPADAPTR